MRVRIEYFDQNETFSRQLPKGGSVVGTPRASDSSLDWYVVQLDVPVVWENTEHTFVLIASRWEGNSIVSAEPTSVFILLVPPQHTVTDGFFFKQYTHVAWGTCHLVAP